MSLPEVLEIPAASLLAGTSLPKVTQGLGLDLKNILSDNQTILDQIMIIKFHNGYIMKFHPEDKQSLPLIFRTVREKMNDITSCGTCSKPIYSPPTGYVEFKNHKTKIEEVSVYVFKYADLKAKRSHLPHFLFLKEREGTPENIRVLARDVQVEIIEGNYLEFKKNNSTIEEVISECEEVFKDLKAVNSPQKERFVYGVSESVEDEPSGFISRKRTTYKYLMCDLLSDKAFLPTKMIRDIKVLSSPISIEVDRKDYTFKKGTSVRDVWEGWKGQLHGDTIGTGEIPLEDGIPIKKYRIQDLILNRASLSTTMSYVSLDDIIIQFPDRSYRDYPRNTLVQRILTELHGLYQIQLIESEGYQITTPEGPLKIRRVIRSVKELISEMGMSGVASDNALFVVADNVSPIIILKGLTNLEAIPPRYEKLEKEVQSLRSRAYFRLKGKKKK